MKKNSKNYFIFAVQMSILTIAYTLLLKKIDVRPVGPEGSSVGFASINSFLAGVFKFNPLWYRISEALGYVAIGLCVIFVIIGIVQMVQRKSLGGIDRVLLVQGFFYAAIIALYILFDKLAITNAPVLINGELQPSFPSSHVVLVCCVMGMAIIAFDFLIESIGLRVMAALACWGIILLMCVGRLISGVHWFTDIVAGIMISISVVAFYHAIVLMPEREE